MDNAEEYKTTELIIKSKDNMLDLNQNMLDLNQNMSDLNQDLYTKSEVMELFQKMRSELYSLITKRSYVVDTVSGRRILYDVDKNIMLNTVIDVF